MTASITIVNTSNWDGENFQVSQKFGGNSQLLKPGESTILNPPTGSGDAIEVRAVPAFDGETKPILAPGVEPGEYGVTKRHNNQVFPKVRVTFEG